MASISSNDDVRALFEDAAVRKGLVATIRGRVPADDVEDLVQAVMCDALSAKAAPDERTELIRWVHGIVRHKVADFHRSRKRNPSDSLPEIPQPHAPFEARSALQWVCQQVSSREHEQTLNWAIREGAGDGLDEIAEELAFNPAALRQRVSRFRRQLRTRYLALAAAVGMLVLGFAAYRASCGRDLPVIVAETSSTPTQAELFQRLQGTWHVVSLRPGQGLDASRAAMASISPKLIRVQVEGQKLRISSPIHQGHRSLVGYSEVTRELEMVDQTSQGQRARLQWEGARLVVTADSGSWQGVIVLER